MMPTQPNLTEAETRLGGALPHRRVEAWKWTDVRNSVKETASGLVSACEPVFELPSDLSVNRAVNTAKDHAMGTLAHNFSGESYLIDVPAGYQSIDVVRLSGLSAGHARIFIKLGKSAELTVIEDHRSDEAGFVNIEVNYDLGEGASLTRTMTHRDHAQSTRIVTSQINAWASAKVIQHALSFGGGLSRLETNVAALGEGLNAQIHGAYLLNDQRHTDMTSYIDLGAPDGVIRQTVKGVVTDKARGVFQGKFHVRRPAQHTDAEMRHDALMLSDTSEIRAKPELEIYADDVECAHGNTLGALDESALFYMRQRGIPLKEARALLTEAFVAEVFDDLAEDRRDDFMTDIRTWLEANS
ncbi:MAG: Fe-S cluster assembly protein SufD [Hyphomonadaceae bacterium]|nr:Fe-S cluster assembly protein SufD [Hyphomonadaceae bacterium]